MAEPSFTCCINLLWPFEYPGPLDRNVKLAETRQYLLLFLFTLTFLLKISLNAYLK